MVGVVRPKRKSLRHLVCVCVSAWSHLAETETITIQSGAAMFLGEIGGVRGGKGERKGEPVLTADVTDGI